MHLHLFKLFIKHRRYKTVAEVLNAEGYRTVNESLFTGQAVSRILKDKKLLENSTIPQKIWDECQAILSSQKRTGHAKRRVAHLCSGLLTCSCGGAMYVPSNSKKYVCKDCRNKIAKDDLEHIILEHFKQIKQDPIKQAIVHWPALPFSAKREIIENTIQSIIADGKKVSITLFAL